LSAEEEEPSSPWQDAVAVFVAGDSQRIRRKAAIRKRRQHGV